MSVMPAVRAARRVGLVCAIIAVTVLAASARAEATSFTCINGSGADCALASSSLSWAWDGLDFTISNAGSGYVSEVYFDLGAGMSASFLGGTGGNVLFYAGASPASLPGAGAVGFVSDASFDSDPAGATHNGIDFGETATFRILGAGLDSFATGQLVGGVHERSLIDSSASLVTDTQSTVVPEPATLSLLGMGVAGLAVRRRRKA